MNKEIVRGTGKPHYAQHCIDLFGDYCNMWHKKHYLASKAPK